MKKPGTAETDPEHYMDGAFVRKPTVFRGHLGSDAYPVEADRYHLYVSLACPWAHRLLIARALKGLEHLVTVDVVDHYLDQLGWSFFRRQPGCTGDTVNGFERLSSVYHQSDPDFGGRITVPILYDKLSRRIVNNESSEILRQLNTAFGDRARRPDIDLYPEELTDRIDAVNEWVYPMFNDGVYRSGFAQTQQAYERAVTRVFEALDRLEGMLGEQRWLAGDRFTEADIRMFATTVRFDLVYHYHFRCNLRRVCDYPNVWAHTREIYQHPLVKPTVDFYNIKHHYFGSHETLNPRLIVPMGPAYLDWDEPHGREIRGGQGLGELVPV